METERADRLKRFDDVFKMLLVVMTITTSIGLSTYSGVNLWSTLAYFIMSLAFWMVGHMIRSNSLFVYHEIMMKLYAWSIGLLVTASTYAKFALKVSTLDWVAKIPVFTITLALSLVTFKWFKESVPSHMSRAYVRAISIILILYSAGYIVF